MTLAGRILRGLHWRLLAVLDFMDARFINGIAAKWGLFHCPVCDTRITRFRHLPARLMAMWKKHGRLKWMKNETCNIRGYECPVCGAPDRARLYAMYLRGWFESQGRGAAYRFLDFAPIRPLSAFILEQAEMRLQRIDYVTADLYRDDVDVNLDIADMSTIPNAAFDFIICSHILEHVPNDLAAMRELYRILKDGGRCIVMVPINLNAHSIDEDPNINSPAVRWARFGKDDHVRMYDKRGFIRRLSSVGFIIRQIDVNSFSRLLFFRSGITQRSVLYVVEKRDA